MPANLHEASWTERLNAVVKDETADEVQRVDSAFQLILQHNEATNSSLATLLTSPNAPSTRRMVIQAIQRAGLFYAGLLDQAWIEPLTTLVKCPPDELTRPAAQALSMFADPAAEEFLMGEATHRGHSEVCRTIAIEALGRNIDRRSVVQCLIGMLRAEDPLSPLIIDHLRPASWLDFGDNILGWEEWWERESKLSEEEWLRSRLALRNRERREVLDRLAAAHEQLAEMEERSRATLEVALRDVYRLTATEQDRERLIHDWLTREHAHFRWMAATLIKERIPEGLVPSDATRAELRRRLEDESPEMRRIVLSILGALRDPADFDSVLQVLAAERDQGVREVAFRTLGLFQDARAIPKLLDEIESDRLTTTEEAEALLALGSLLQRTKPEHDADSARLRAMLMDRMGELPSDAIRRRRGLLISMAARPDPGFENSFITAINQESAELLVPAIEGLAALKNGSQNDRLIVLLRHADPSVRKAAATALGSLAQNPAAIEQVLKLCDPKTETAEAVREAAWNALSAWLSTRPLEEQWAWAERIPEPSEIDYLTRLVQSSSANPEAKAIMVNAARRLAESLDALGRVSDAIPHWRRLYEASLAENDHSAFETGLRWVADLLRSETSEELPQALCHLMQGSSEAEKARLVELVMSEVDRLRSNGKSGHADALSALFSDPSALPCQQLWADTINAATTNSSESS